MRKTMLIIWIIIGLIALAGTIATLIIFLTGNMEGIRWARVAFTISASILLLSIFTIIGYSDPIINL